MSLATPTRSESTRRKSERWSMRVDRSPPIYVSAVTRPGGLGVDPQ